MGKNKIAEEREGEQKEVFRLAQDIRTQINEMGCEIETQVNLPYTNFCDRIDADEQGVDYVRGKLYYTTDVLIYKKLEDGGKIPLVVVEGKIKRYTTHDVIVYSEKARAHKTVFPHLQYGFVVLNAENCEFKMLRYYVHSNFDFEEIFPEDEILEQKEVRIAKFVEMLSRQVDLAKEKYRRFFGSEIL